MVIFVGGGRSPKYVRVPVALIERIRKVSVFLGVSIIVLSIGVGVAALPWAFMLSTADNPLTFVLLAFVLIQVLLGLVSGITAIFGRSCVSTGELDYVSGSGLFRVNLVFLVFTVLCTIASWLLMALLAATSESGFTLGLLAYLILIAVPAILTTVSVLGASRLVRGTRSVIHKYAW